jgi:hypothetical protein
MPPRKKATAAGAAGAPVSSRASARIKSQPAAPAKRGHADSESEDDAPKPPSKKARKTTKQDSDTKIDKNADPTDSKPANDEPKKMVTDNSDCLADDTVSQFLSGHRGQEGRRARRSCIWIGRCVLELTASNVECPN